MLGDCRVVLGLVVGGLGCGRGCFGWSRVCLSGSLTLAWWLVLLVAAGFAAYNDHGLDLWVTAVEVSPSGLVPQDSSTGTLVVSDVGWCFLSEPVDLPTQATHSTRRTRGLWHFLQNLTWLSFRVGSRFAERRVFFFSQLHRREK